MLKYLKEAFWVRERIPLLGDVPVNCLAVLAFLALGFGHPGFWLLGLGGEIAFLWALASNLRFQKLVDAPRATADLIQLERKRHSLIKQLSARDATRLAELEEKERRVRTLYAEFGYDDFAASQNLTNLEKLRWMYLKLLTARRHLQNVAGQTGAAGLRQEITSLNDELRSGTLTSTVEASKKATLEILEERFRTHRRREESLREIETDLARIEAQFNLALEKATLKAKPGEISFNLDLASELLDSDEFFGSSSRVVYELDRSFDEEQTVSES